VKDFTFMAIDKETGLNAGIDGYWDWDPTLIEVHHLLKRC